MSIITMVNLSSIDLNLLHVLSVVLEERSATRAARRLNVSQSAVSNALARLRDVLGDPLVVRSGQGLVPTPRALELAPVLTEAIERLQQVVDGGRDFDPLECERSFCLAAADGQQLSDLPAISSALEKAMPRARLHVVSIDTLIATDGLATGQVDLSIAPPQAHPGMPHSRLYVDDGVALLRREHPFRGRRLSARAFAEIPHVGLNIAMGRPGVGHAFAERAFAKAGLTRNIVLTVPGFVAAAMVVASTDYLTCLSRRAARTLASYLPVRVVELPPCELGSELHLVWHPRTQHDPAVAYLRKVIVEALADGRARTRAR